MHPQTRIGIATIRAISDLCELTLEAGDVSTEFAFTIRKKTEDVVISLGPEAETFTAIAFVKGS